MVCELAKRGNTTARQALYDHFDPIDDFRFASEIIEVDVLDGLDWALSQSSDRVIGEGAWPLKWWVDDLKDAIGAENVAAWLEQNADQPVIILLGELEERESRRQWKRPREPSLTYEEFKAQSGAPNVPRVSIWSWVDSAPKFEMAKAWREFETEQDSDWLFKLARGLRRKTRDADIDTLVDLAKAWKEDGNPFLFVLKEIVDERVRNFGQELIAAGRFGDGFGLFAKNARPGDEDALLAAARLLTDDWEIESAGLDLFRLEKSMVTPAMLLWIYEQAPCSFCREHAVSDLVELNAAPAYVLEECLLDCVDETREIARASLHSAN